MYLLRKNITAITKPTMMTTTAIVPPTAAATPPPPESPSSRFSTSPSFEAIKEAYKKFYTNTNQNF